MKIDLLGPLERSVGSVCAWNMLAQLSKVIFMLCLPRIICWDPLDDAWAILVRGTCSHSFMKLPPFPRLSIDLATGHYIVLLALYAPQCPSPTSPAIKKTSTKIVPYLETDLAQGNDASLICYLAARVCLRVDRSSSLYLCWWGRTEKC